MAKRVVPLSDVQCRRAKYIPGGKNKYFDGGGLFLEVRATGLKRWCLRYVQLSGKPSQTALGEYPALSLADARLERDRLRALVAKGIAPTRRQTTAKSPSANTFERIAEEWLATRKAGWSEGYYSRMSNALKANVYPRIGDMAMGDISGKLVLDTVRIVEARGALDMASRVLEATGMVFRYAVATGCVHSDVTNKLAGYLADRPPVQHYPHVGADRLGELLYRVEHYHGRPETRFAIRLMMRTFPRTSELCSAQWDEFDLDGALWAIPPARMKGRLIAKLYGESHLIPLSTQLVDMLKEMRQLTGRHPFVLPGAVNPATQPVSKETINKALRILGYAHEQTGHGFRGLASTIMNESGKFRERVIEAQLSHKPRNVVAGAYNHAIYLRERRDLMQWWSDYLQTKLEAYTPA